MLYEIHMIKNYPPANLNRDDTGSPKTCYFGGSLRGRISSQCLKRTWRTSDLFEALLGERASRTRKLPELVREELVSRGMAEDMADVAKQKVTGIGNKDGKEDAKGITAQTMFFSQHDVNAVADMMEKFAQDSETVKKFEKVKASEVAKAMKEVSLRPITLDIAMFGRMVTSDAFANVEAAVQTAHALSTHIVNQESDYFVAMDDLLAEGDAGADMMGDIEYNSSCYYHYMAIDTDQLAHNLKNSPDAEDYAQDILAAMVEIMAYSNPSGKQNSFASHVLPEVLYVEVKDKKVPTSYANAFATPVRFGGRTKLIEESAKALVGEIDLLTTAYGLEKTHCAWFAPRTPEVAPAQVETVASLPELLSLCRNWMKA